MPRQQPQDNNPKTQRRRETGQDRKGQDRQTKTYRPQPHAPSSAVDSTGGHGVQWRGRGLTLHWSRPRQWWFLLMRQSVHGAAAHRRRSAPEAQRKKSKEHQQTGSSILSTGVRGLQAYTMCHDHRWEPLYERPQKKECPITQHLTFHKLFPSSSRWNSQNA